MEKSDFTRELVARHVGCCVKVGMNEQDYVESTPWELESTVDWYLYEIVMGQVLIVLKKLIWQIAFI